MSVLARFEEAAARGERRGTDRRALRLTITASMPESPALAVTIHDLSETGILLETSTTLEPGQSFQVELPQVGAVDTIAVWNSGKFYGCRFAEIVPRSAVSAVLLQSVPSRGETPPANVQQDLLSQLSDLNERIARVAEDLDRTIENLAAERGQRSLRDRDAGAALPPKETADSEEYSEPLGFGESDATRPVIIASAVLAVLAVLILVVALLAFPLAL